MVQQELHQKRHVTCSQWCSVITVSLEGLRDSKAVFWHLVNRRNSLRKVWPTKLGMMIRITIHKCAIKQWWVDEKFTCKWWNLHSSWEFPLHGTHGWGRQSEAKLRFLPGLKKLCITGSGTYYLCLTQNGEMKLREGKIFLMCWK